MAKQFSSKNPNDIEPGPPGAKADPPLMRHEAGPPAAREHAGHARRERAAFLGATEEWFRGILHSAPDGMLVVDERGIIILVNAELARMFGYAESELIGQTVEVLVPIDLRRQHADDRLAFATTMRAGASARIARDLRACRKDGSEFAADITLSRLPDADGDVRTICVAVRDVTERKRMEEALAAREREFRSLAENLPEPVFRYDTQCRRIYVNPAIQEFARVSPEHLLGRTPVEMQTLGPATAQRIQERVQYVLDSGEKTAIEVQLVAPDHSERWIRVVYVPELAPDGSVQSVLSIGHDETERHRLEAELRRRTALEEQLSSLAKTVPGFLFLLRREPDGRMHFPFASEGIVDLVGLRPEDIRDDLEVLRARYHRDDLMRVRQCMAESARSLTPYSFEMRIRHPHKGERWMEVRGTPRQQADGAIEWHGLMFDVTERKHAELARDEARMRLLNVLQTIPDMVWLKDADGVYLSCNHAFERLVGKGESDIVGSTDLDLFDAELAEFFRDRDRAAIEARSIVINEEWVTDDPSGQRILLETRKVPVFGPDGKVTGVLGVARDVTELSVFRQKIHQMAFYDPLTSLPNRALFNDRLRQMIADASWHGQSAGVMLIDMDRFKAVNDTMGHAAGDELLRETAARLSACVRAYDTVARLGGDEFAVLLPEIRQGDDLGRIASKILGKFDERFVLDGREVFVSCSIGIALYPDDSTDADDLVKFADSAMYFAKRSGRNNFRFYSKDLTASATERLTLESELRRAIERNELELHYQPKVLLRDGTMAGSEALLRWRNARLGMVPPNRFIQIAEDTGLIVDLGEWVLREACRTASEWNAEGSPPHKVAINLSARQFQARDLAGTVADILDETACRAEWIELEITESLLLDEDGKALETLSTLRAMGITIAIDDFGTGYSALSYLARFPIDTLKIDRSFIHGVATGGNGAELVKAILSIARCLGQEVVAEGVETAEQAAFLEANGCPAAQGFLFSKPLPKTELAFLPRRFGLCASTAGAAKPSC